MELPWIEKYRPQRIADVVGNEEILSRFVAMVQRNEIMNLILSGPSGIGKTSSAVCLARDVLGDKFDDAALELNASDERGVEVVREKIKTFAHILVNIPENRPKIVILDEADCMTEGAQQALRTIIESSADTTRFIMTCNNPNKIIEPIQSRCVMLRFGSLKDEQITRKILEVCRMENVKYNQDGIGRILFSCQGDLRLAINYLQSVVFGFGIVTPENVQKIVDKPHPKLVQNILESSISNNFHESSKLLIDLWSLGYSPMDIMGTMFRVMKDLRIESEKKRLDILREIGLSQVRVLDGYSSLPQMFSLIARISGLFLH